MIQATIFKAYIKQFSEALSVNDVYYLSNARILKIPQEYRLVDNDYQIIFHGGTTIEQLPAESFVLPEQRSNFVSLQDLGALKDLKNFDSTLHTIGLTSNAPTPEMIKDISTIFEFFDGSKKQQGKRKSIQNHIEDILMTDYYFTVKCSKEEFENKNCLSVLPLEHVLVPMIPTKLEDGTMRIIKQEKMVQRSFSSWAFFKCGLGYLGNFH
ncbi:hypothetical protein QJS10_CPA05g02192 [Acorus calamus]|uniref:Uncharacterized protein n=1 Tax=Acorus calamus TaxID=4465 RepID=A0AAV9EW77_ACOCL|nr:hypothetical protein QJS10_CPA05g02192 [Acorus calamus]